MPQSRVMFNWRAEGEGSHGKFRMLGVDLDLVLNPDRCEKPVVRIFGVNTRKLRSPCQMEIPVESVPAVADAMLQRVGELPPEQKQKIYIKWRGRGILAPQMSPVGYLFATQAEANAFLRGLRVMESQSGVTNSFVQTDETGREL